MKTLLLLTVLLALGQSYAWSAQDPSPKPDTVTPDDETRAITLDLTGMT